uniref:Uncharacterized protein n=1 Tax=Anopheles merus TaxID=30066 RepID=A0A182VH69_ANOME
MCCIGPIMTEGRSDFDMPSRYLNTSRLIVVSGLPFASQPLEVDALCVQMGRHVADRLHDVGIDRARQTGRSIVLHHLSAPIGTGLCSVTGVPSGSRIASSRSGKSSAYRHMAPGVKKLPQFSSSQDGWCPYGDTTYGEGLWPNTPVNMAGRREEPAISVVTPSSDPAAAISAASPPDDPPAVRCRLYGLRVRPVHWLYVSQHRHSSGVLLTSSTIPPARLIWCTTGASLSATFFSRSFRPAVLLMPSTAKLSLIETGSPSRGLRVHLLAPLDVRTDHVLAAYLALADALGKHGGRQEQQRIFDWWEFAALYSTAYALRIEISNTATETSTGQLTGKHHLLGESGHLCWNVELLRMRTLNQARTHARHVNYIASNSRLQQLKPDEDQRTRAPLCVELQWSSSRLTDRVAVTAGFVTATNDGELQQLKPNDRAVFGAGGCVEASSEIITTAYAAPRARRQLFPQLGVRYAEDDMPGSGALR